MFKIILTTLLLIPQASLATQSTSQETFSIQVDPQLTNSNKYDDIIDRDSAIPQESTSDFTTDTRLRKNTAIHKNKE
jgi:hypothetical protein